MRVLINVNEQISPTMMERHFQASSLEAEVTAAPNDTMLETVQACKFDLVAFYADEVENNTLISFFNATGSIRKILFVKRQNLALVNEALESILDECFSIPISSGDFMLRIRRMFRDEEQEISELPVPVQESKPEERKQALPVKSEPEPESAAETPELTIEPIKTDFSYTAEDFLPQPDQNEKVYDLPPCENAPVKINKDQPVSSAKTPAQKKKAGGKKKSPLRYLNKTELLEIILEQEKMLSELNLETARIKEELDKRHIILEEAGSIAEAALKLNGVFEAAQKSADQYLDSIKAVSN